MKHKEFAVIGKKLLPNLPGFVIKGPMLFKSPVGDTLYSLHFDGSDFDAKAFYLWAFFMPLYVPHAYISFLFGERLGGQSDRWDANSPNLIGELVRAVQQEATPFFNRTSSMSGIIQHIQPMVIPNTRGYVNPHCQEALAYTLAKMGDVAAALVVIDQMHEMLSKSSVGWELEIKARSQLMREKLLQSPEATQAQLEAWKEETIQNLKLQTYR